MPTIRRPGISVVLVAGVFFLATGDAVRQFRFASMTGAALAGLLITYLILVGMLMHVAGRKYRPGHESELSPRNPVPIPLVLWLIWTAVVTLANYGLPDDTIVHPATMYLGLVGGMWLMAQKSTVSTPDLLLKWAILAGWTLVVLFGVQIVQHGFEPTGGLISRRAFGLTAMIAVAYLSAYWGRLSTSQRILVAILGVEIGFSGSRTALFVSALAFTLAAIAHNRGQWRVLILRAVLALGTLYALITYWGPLRDRFETGDGGSFGGVQINTSGREYFWQNLLNYYREHPLFGGGMGQAERVMVQYTPNINQPHNDYLRILVDSGLVGLILFVIGMLLLIRRLWTLAFRTDTEHRELHVASLLVLGAFLISAYTDNPIVYPFVVYPMAAILGCSLSWWRPRRPLPDSDLVVTSSSSADECPGGTRVSRSK